MNAPTTELVGDEVGFMRRPVPPCDARVIEPVGGKAELSRRLVPGGSASCAGTETARPRPQRGERHTEFTLADPLSKSARSRLRSRSTASMSSAPMRSSMRSRAEPSQRPSAAHS